MDGWGPPQTSCILIPERLKHLWFGGVTCVKDHRMPYVLFPNPARAHFCPINCHLLTYFVCSSNKYHVPFVLILMYTLPIQTSILASCCCSHWDPRICLCCSIDFISSLGNQLRYLFHGSIFDFPPTPQLMLFQVQISRWVHNCSFGLP